MDTRTAMPGTWRGPTTRQRLGAALLMTAAAAAAQPLQLVTDAEAERERAAAPPAVAARAAPPPDAPTIRVIAPALTGQALAVPMRIELAFAAAPDAEIDPASFRATYGSLRLDITSRIVSRVAVGKGGLAVDGVVIPSGSHRLLLRIADTKARSSEADLRFSVQ